MTGRIMTISVSGYFKKKIYLVVFILGLVLGTLLINILSKDYYEKINVTQEHYINMISDVVINKNDILINEISAYFKEFVIILIANCFFFGKLYNIFYLMVKGAGIGIIISSYVMKYGVRGLFVYTVSIFPHYIIYVPAVILTICAGISLRNIVIQNSEKNEKYIGKNLIINDVFKILIKILMYFTIILIFAILISIVETYINIPMFTRCLKKT